MQVSEKLQILLVEDNISDAKLTQYALSRLTPSPELIHFDAGEEFLDYLDKADTHTVLLILLDLNLPRMSGLDILRVLRRQKAYRKFPVVMFSSSGEQRDVNASYDCGANAYVQKPLSLEDFDRAMEAIVNFWSCINKIPRLAGA